MDLCAAINRRAALITASLIILVPINVLQARIGRFDGLRVREVVRAPLLAVGAADGRIRLPKAVVPALPMLYDTLCSMPSIPGDYTAMAPLSRSFAIFQGISQHRTYDDRDFQAV